jgi:hypothetical protein
LKKRCIDEETLADFLEGRLKGAKLNAAEEHLADCDQCLDIIKIGSGLIRGGESNGTLPVPDNVTREAVNIVGRLNKDRSLSATEKVSSSIKEISSKVSRWFSHEFRGSPQLAPVRGEWQIVSDNVIQVKKKFRSFQAGIEIEKTDNDMATIRVTMISGEKGHSGTRVTLKKEEREVSSDLMNGKLVVFESIPFGKYSLVFSRMGEAMGNYKFEIKETVNES